MHPWTGISGDDMYGVVDAVSCLISSWRVEGYVVLHFMEPVTCTTAWYCESTRLGSP